jgi:hypothetical protein
MVRVTVSLSDTMHTWLKRYSSDNDRSVSQSIVNLLKASHPYVQQQYGTQQAEPKPYSPMQNAPQNLGAATSDPDEYDLPDYE